MDADSGALPDDIDALKAALIAARADAAAVSAELAHARAVAANDRSLITHLKLEIEKLRRQLYGTRSERKARLLEQIPICLFPKNFQAAYLTFIQSWDAQHIAEILYLKYFYVVVYSDGG